jgi:hypothetical protein
MLEKQRVNSQVFPPFLLTGVSWVDLAQAPARVCGRLGILQAMSFSISVKYSETSERDT